MKRIGYTWTQITSFENLLIAYKKARLGKRSRNEVALFGLNLETNLLQLQDELINKTYMPGAYRLFTIYERKPRRGGSWNNETANIRSSARNRNNTDNRNNNVGFRAASPPL